MKEAEYILPNRGRVIFEYDDYGIGKISIEAMDSLMELAGAVKVSNESVSLNTEGEDMTERELLALIEVAPKEQRAELLQTYIQRYGPLSYAVGKAIRQLLKGE